ncbi:helix-turn-helix transcriptional regulator [Lentilactobacillus hilgardii]|uniref:Helix-turn-helix domain-containing protein n=1 Tax=Lentilactobacillus hilgardii TaxID=1588 RepID=A0A6P1E5E9_LENHI|nr:helix-turn-helix transcriptional regulator [Lentilactobacillus hilgardii]MCT3392578.1 XRE family transcriptional regulator [Lentilactobacillus hilgardii]QHB50905.1 helix-turn-helix domain-containing protein [Lentilactobacillus hilgardii]RRG08329.1 MAG: XRE family transcriptional regulator [Lactobacillus sp.]
MTELSKKIKQYRKEKNLTQKQLAEKMFVSRKLISNWENGRNFPDFRAMIRLSEIFEIKIDDLLKNDNKVIEHFDDQGKQTKKDGNILWVCYNLNFLFLILSYIHMFRPFGFHASIIPLSLIINILVFFSHYSNWDSFKKNRKLVLSIISFTILLLINVFSMVLNFNFQKSLNPNNVIGTFGAAAGEFTLILLITFSMTLAIFFRPAKEKGQHKNK